MKKIIEQLVISANLFDESGALNHADILDSILIQLASQKKDTADFDPDSPTGDGIYCLPHTTEQAHVVIIPVPFEATVSYRTGTARGPEAIFAASRQVDLRDADAGRPYEAGIAMEEAPEWMTELNRVARTHAIKCIQAQENGNQLNNKNTRIVDKAGKCVNLWVKKRVTELLEDGKLPVIIGGDHSAPFGAIIACQESIGKRSLGILHLDAHCDLRDSYEGFRWSHASIMKNVLDTCPRIKLVQFGIRDFSDSEAEIVKKDPRIKTYFDAELREARLDGSFKKIANKIIEDLPDDVYLSFDIDGLDPILCPSTGTPVPGGISFDEIIYILKILAESGKRIIGLDLVEVAPPADCANENLENCWDANVGARLLYKMIGFSLISNGKIPVI